MLLLMRGIQLFVLIFSALIGSCLARSANETYYVRRILQEDIEVVPLWTEIQYAQGQVDGPDGFWTGEVIETGEILELEGLDEADPSESLTIDDSGKATMKLRAVIRRQEAKLRIQPGSKLNINRPSGNGVLPRNRPNINQADNIFGIRDQEDALGEEEHHVRRRLAVLGNKTVLAIRVIAADANTTSNLNEISDSIFGTYGDTVNLKSQYKACSYDKLKFEPFNGFSTSGVNISDGVFEVTITSTVSGAEDSVIREAVKAEATAQLGSLPDQFDHVMLCLPPGTSGGWIGYAYVNSWLSVYNDNWCNYVSIQMHELGHNIGLAHAGQAGQGVYDDQSGMMGYSYGSSDSPVMCFNGAKNWQLGWYDEKRIDVTDSIETGGFWSGRLRGITDNLNDQDDFVIFVRIQGNDAEDYYINFNRKIGFNSGTKEGGDQVLVTSRAKGTGYAQSWLEAKLSSGNAYSKENFEVTVDVIDTVTSPGYADITISVVPTPAPSTSPSTSPSLSAFPTITPPPLTMESMVVTGVNDTDWTPVNLEGQYVSPVPVCTVEYPVGFAHLPTVVRMQSVTSSLLQIRLQHTDSAVTLSYVANVHCLVVEEGVYEMPGGGKIEAQRYTSTVTDRKSNWNGEQQYYLQSYADPVVVGQVMTFNDVKWSVFWSRGLSLSSDPPGVDGLRTGKHVGEDTTTTRADETVGFIVMEAGHGTLASSQHMMEASVGADAVLAYDNAVSFQYNYMASFGSAPQVIVVSQTAMDGNDGSWAVLSGADQSESGFGVVLDEDQYGDSERAHTSEQVSYIAMERAIFLSDTFAGPSSTPSDQPSGLPSSVPSTLPSLSNQPSSLPSDAPSMPPSLQPSDPPSRIPSILPSVMPSLQPSSLPSNVPSSLPSLQPSSNPSKSPSPSGNPSSMPSNGPTRMPSNGPTRMPSNKPSLMPSDDPSQVPSSLPTEQESNAPSRSAKPSSQPSKEPSFNPSESPSDTPSEEPSKKASSQPSDQPSLEPSMEPSAKPSVGPSLMPSDDPSQMPSSLPTEQESNAPSRSAKPSLQPSKEPSVNPSESPSDTPSEEPSEKPSSQPSDQPSLEPSMEPSAEPSVGPSDSPSLQPSGSPFSCDSLTSSGGGACKKYTDSSGTKPCDWIKGSCVEI